MLISSNDSSTSPAKDAIDNTLYFNVSNGPIDPPDYQALVDDLYAIWAARAWQKGRHLDIRAYNMEDPTPRPVKARKTGSVTGTALTGPRQIACCLSYFADRNLPRQRGRIYIGPWGTAGNALYPGVSTQNEVIALAQPLADLGGVNVDWSLWSPTTQQHTRITNAWVDNSWDVIRSRKLAAVGPRVSWTGNG